LFNRTNAATRHAVWFGVLLFVTALIPAHLLLSFRPRPEILAAATRPASSMMAIGPATSYAGNTAGSPVADAAFPNPQAAESDAGSINGTSYSPVGGPQGEWASREIGSKGRPDAVAPEKTWSRFASAALKPLSWNLKTAVNLPHSICLCLVSAWVLLAGVRGGLIVGRIGEVRRVKTTSSVPSHGLQTLFDRLRDSLTARRNVRLRISSIHHTAVVLGFVHPVVLLPAEMDKDANESEVEHVLRHELAHVDRRDDWGNLAQQFIQAALFFHPAVWWISARLSLEREIACDDYVLEGSARPRAYALTLANVASRMSHCQHLLAPGVSNNNSQLQQRITMILNTHRDRSPRLARSRLGFFTTTAALLAVLAINAGPRLVLAQSPALSPAAAEPGDTAPPPSPIAPVADGSPAALPPDWSEADSGPRTKTALNDNDNAPLPLTTQADPAARALPPMPALASIDQVPAVPSVPPVPPSGRASKRHMSVEERLDRIERILEDLEARGGAKGRQHGDDRVSAYDGKLRSDPAGAMKMDFNLDWELKRAADQAKKAADEVRQAVETGQRAAEAGERSAEQAMREIAKLKNKDFERMQGDLRDAESEGPLKELEALRAARASLQEQIQKLERQIKHLEEDQNRQKKRANGRSDRPDDAPQNEKIAPEKTS
jgi:beta-lactamase regulating signal transducer with metallopeptidase domain